METSITIRRDTVFRQVARRMEWVSTRSPEENDYDRLAISESDKGLYHAFFDEAAMHAIDIFRPFLLSVSNTDESLTLNLDVSAEADINTLGMTAANMVAMHVLALWLEIVSPPRASSGYAKRDDSACKIQSILYFHSAPVRSVGRKV